MAMFAAAVGRKPGSAAARAEAPRPAPSHRPPPPVATRACACGGGCPRCDGGAGLPERSGPLGTLTIRRAVPVNAPHPGNQVADIEDDEPVVPGQVRRSPKVGSSDDPAEVEADLLAEHILHTPQPEDSIGLRPLALTSSGGGHPLASATRAFFEPRLGTSLANVRVHRGPRAATTAAELNARAFAYGSDIWLGAGEHESDRRLMGHELTHVLQASDAHAAPALIRRYVRSNTTFLWDLYVSKGSDAANVTDAELRDTIEYEDYIRADLVWRFSDTVALGALRRSMDLFATGVRGRQPNFNRSGQEASAAAHGLQQVELTELGFTGDHLITDVPAWGAAAGSTIDDPDGSAPVWTNGGVTDPVAYTKGTVPTVFARFSVTPAITPSVANVELRAKVGTTVIGTASGVTMGGTTLEGGGGTGQVNGIGGGSAVPGSGVAGQLNEAVDFELSTDGGRIWFQAGSAPVHFFFTEATPTPPGGTLRKDALDIATLAAATTPIPDTMARFVQALVFYNPSVVMPANFATSDAVMETLSTPHQCDSQAFLMRYLLMTLGISADVDYFWRGTSSKIIVYSMTSSTWWGPSYQYDRPAEDLAEASPHFLFHALTNVGGTRYDPTYGQTSPGARLESAPGATDQFASRATFLATPLQKNPWQCPH